MSFKTPGKTNAILIDSIFCDFLDSWMCKTFRESHDHKLRYLWCDGILMNQPDTCYSQKYINDKRETRFLAYIGNDGQLRYDVILKFGPRTLSCYSRDLSIEECMPDMENGFYIDTETRICVIQLK